VERRHFNFLRGSFAGENKSSRRGQRNHTAVDCYLGRSGNDLLSIPQIVAIDRAGTIRANVNSLRILLEPLLKES
jgi:hypothetical protein